MASVSLYRKYRSQTFAEVVGQGHVTTTLTQAVAEGRLHHAYLFTGPRGTGKTSTARILAKSLNCEQGPTPEPCNACVHCRAITDGSHVDVIEIDAASHGGVDDVRDLRDRVAFSPAQARTKVYIVDECHMLSTAGWNAFLKTLEEPPGHVVFVFATTEPHKVLDTILSRTQRFDFKPIEAGALTTLAADLAAREGLDLEDGALELVVRAADGSARDTLSILDQVVAFTGRQVTVTGVTEVLGSIPEESLAAVADHVAAGDVAGACALVGAVAEAGYDLRQFAKDAVEHLRSLFLLQVAPEAGLVATTPERLERLSAQSGRIGRVELLRTIELITDAQAHMRRGATRLALEIALAKAAMPEASGDPAALAARLDRLERSGGEITAEPRTTPGTPAAEGPASPQPGHDEAPAEPFPEAPAEAFPEAPAEASPADAGAAPPAPEGGERGRGAGSEAASGALTLASVERAWDAVLDAVKQRKIRFQAFLQMSRPVALEDGVLTLEFRFGYGLHAEQCASDAGQEIIGSALEQVVGSRLALRCVVADSATPAGRLGATASGAPSEPVGPEAITEAEAQAVAESEAAEDQGEPADEDTRHQEVVDRLKSELGATVVDDEYR